MEVMTMIRKRALLIATLAVACLTSACGPRVARLTLDDPRLPLEARRWLADAEDEISIARASRDEATSALEEAREFRTYVNQTVLPNLPRSGAASTAEQRLERMVQERIRVAELDLEAAEARIVLANAMLIRARAETAVRHDLAAYDLEPIVDATDAARREVDELAAELERQRIAVDEATTAWWESYGAYLAADGDSTVLWRWE